MKALVKPLPPLYTHPNGWTISNGHGLYVDGSLRAVDNHPDILNEAAEGLNNEA